MPELSSGHSQETVPETAPTDSIGIGRGILLPCVLLLGAMFNLTLVVAGLKEFILEDMGGTVADATLFFSVETFAYILFAPLWGLVSDRWSTRKPLIVTGFLVSGLLYAAYGVIHDINLLLALRFVQGAFSVMGWSTVMTLMLDHPTGGKRGRYMGLMGAALIFGVALGAPVGGYITRWYGPRAPLTAAAISFGILTVGALFLASRPVRTYRVRIDEILQTFRSQPRLFLPYSVHFVDRLAVGLFVVVFPLYLDSLGAGDAAVRGRYLSFFLVPFALLQFFTGKMTEKTGPYTPLIVGSLLYGVLLSTVGYSGLMALKPIMMLLGAFAAVMFPPAILLTARLSEPHTRGSAMGGFNQAGSLGFAVGPLLGAWAYATRGFGFAFLLCGILEIILAIVAMVFVLRWRRTD